MTNTVLSKKIYNQNIILFFFAVISQSQVKGNITKNIVFFTEVPLKNSNNNKNEN